MARRGANGAADQATALEAEGVEVGRGRLGERLVDLSRFGHFPDPDPDPEEGEEDSEED